MRTILHDLKEKDLKHLKVKSDDILINCADCKKHCIGCFSCWVKHPKKCALNDEFSNIVEYLKDSEELIIISKCRYGCYSSEVKRVLERCIGYVLPYFTIRNKEIHHACRFLKKLKFKVLFYENVSKEDKEIVESLVKANSINLNTNGYEINYYNNLKELLKCTH